MEITEDSLFECLEDNERKDSPRDASSIVGSIKDWRSWMHDLAESYGEPESYHELIDDAYPDYIIEMLGNDFGLDLSKPGEVEYENICKKIAKTMQVGDRNTFVFRDGEKVVCVSQEDNASDCITKYDSWKECFDYVFYSQLKDDINDLGLAEVFGLERGQYPINKEYLTPEDFTFLNKDDPDMFAEWNFSPFDLENDLDKRRDFCNLDENEFLKKYSYIGGEDYEITELLNPEFAKERDIMLSGKMEDVKLDYLFNKYHIRDHQDRAITLADIQNKDFKDIQLQINSPVLERGASITIVAEDLDDFVKCLKSWGYADFDIDEEIRMAYEEGWIETEADEVLECNYLQDVKEELLLFANDIQKWNEQSKEYEALRSNAMDNGELKIENEKEYKSPKRDAVSESGQIKQEATQKARPSRNW